MKKNYILCILISLLCGLSQINSQTGNSLHFDGVDDEINCGNDPSVQITGSSMTLELKIKFDSYAVVPQLGTIISKEGSTDNSGYLLRIGGNTPPVYSGVINFGIADGGNWYELFSAADELTIGTWHHLAATYDGTWMTIYVDGVHVASRSFVGVNISNNSDNLFIGNWNQGTGRNINATIDDVRIWNIARTESEILNNKDNDLSLPQTGLVAYYKFNQGSAGGNNATETTAIDELGFSNGSLVNFDLNGTTSNWTEDVALSISENNLTNAVLYPNPSSDFIQVSGLKKEESYTIYNITATNIKAGKISNKEKINIRELADGMFFLKLENGNTIKFIKK